MFGARPGQACYRATDWLDHSLITLTAKEQASERRTGRIVARNQVEGGRALAADDPSFQKAIQVDMFIRSPATVHGEVRGHLGFAFWAHALPQISTRRGNDDLDEPAAEGEEDGQMELVGWLSTWVYVRLCLLVTGTGENWLVGGELVSAVLSLILLPAEPPGVFSSML
jgi:hypothetical protein